MILFHDILLLFKLLFDGMVIYDNLLDEAAKPMIYLGTANGHNTVTKPFNFA